MASLYFDIYHLVELSIQRKATETSEKAGITMIDSSSCIPFISDFVFPIADVRHIVMTIPTRLET